jgi:hypothetical protein
MMKIIKEIIAAGLLRPHINDSIAAHGNDLLKMQIAAFEFRNDWIQILDVDGYRPAGRRMELGRIEFMVLDDERQRNRIVRAPGIWMEQAGASEQQWQEMPPLKCANPIHRSRQGAFLCSEVLI